MSIKKFRTKTKLILITFLYLVLSSCGSNSIEYSNWELVASNQDFPEGITWDNNSKLYSSNCYGGWITRIEGNKIDTFLIASDSTFGKTNGMFALNDSVLLACDYGNGKILKINSDGKCKVLLSGFENKPFNRPNDITIDKNGNIYFSDPKSYGEDNLDGRVFYYSIISNKLIKIADSLAFPNGIGISPIDNRLYICESAKSRILRFNIEPNGSLTNKEIFIELPGGDPDGFNFDIYGNMYVAHFGSGTLYIIDTNGKIKHKIETPGLKPSNVEFGDKDRKTLYLTEDETNSIYKMKVSIPGFTYSYSD